MWDLQICGAVSRLIEQDVSGLARLLYVGRQPEEVLDGRGLDLVDDVIVEDEPEAARLDDGDVVAPIRARAAVDDDGHEVVHAIGVDGVVWLKWSILKARKQWKRQPLPQHQLTRRCPEFHTGMSDYSK